MRAINTKELTLNNKVRSIVREEIKNIAYTTRVHIAGFGYVLFLKDIKGDILGKVFKDDGAMKLHIN